MCYKHFIVIRIHVRNTIENCLCVIEEQQDSQREPKLICTLGLA
jgi:hypothetical protein